MVHAVNLSNRGITSVAQGGLTMSCFETYVRNHVAAQRVMSKHADGIPAPDIAPIMYAIILDYNDLTAVPDMQDALEDFDIVSAAHNNISKFPPQDFFVKCSHLILNNNMITEFAATENPFKSAQNMDNRLMVIDLDFNQITTFGTAPEGFCPLLSTPTTVATGSKIKYLS